MLTADFDYIPHFANYIKWPNIEVSGPEYNVNPKEDTILQCV